MSDRANDLTLDLTPADFVAASAADPRWLLVDVRESWELDIAAVEGALHLPMAEVASRAEKLDRNRPIAVLCHSGIRSAVVAAWLREQGFERVANISGGIDAWSTTVDSAIPRY